MDPVTGVSDRSPVVGGEAGLAGGTEEEEAMDKVKNKKKKKKKEVEEKGEIGEAGSPKICSFFSPFDKRKNL